MSDPLAALEELAAEWEREGQIMARRLIAAPELRVAIAKTREALGDVEVSDEWGSVLPDAFEPDVFYASLADAAADCAFSPCRIAYRTVTTTKHVTPWTPVEEA